MEPTQSVRARQTLPDQIQRELDDMNRLIIHGGTTSVEALLKAISLNEQALISAREHALKPPRTALRWKLF